MGQEIEFLTDLTHLAPGETATIPIAINLQTPTKVRNITAQFHAAERAEATYVQTSTDHKGRTTTTTQTSVSYHDIVKQDFVLAGEPSTGFLAGIGNFFASLIGAGKGVRLNAGRHEYAVALTIPKHAPPSMEGKKCSIFYKLSVRVNLPLKFDFKEEHKFEVDSTADEQLQGEPVVAHYPDEKGQGFWQRTFGKDARLTLALQTNYYWPGDDVVALFQAETDSPIKIRSAMARIICVESTRAHGHTDSHTHAIEPVTIADAQEIHGGFSTKFNLHAELVGPRSTQADNFEVEWFVEVRLDVPWATDPSIRAPIRMLGSPPHK